MVWRSLKDELPQGDGCVILFPLISDVGILYSASNPEYARKTALMQGYTHWMPIPEHPDHDRIAEYCRNLD